MPTNIDPKSKFGLVLPAGGARAAYQMGILRYIAEAFPDFAPKIFSGVSAGSINATYLAQGEPFGEATKRGVELWEQLKFTDVMQTHFRSLFSMLVRWTYDISLSKVTRKLLLKSLLDAKPLAHTLASHIHFWKISRAVRTGFVEGISVSATNYHDGKTTIFFDTTNPVPEWKREQRKGVRTTIRVRHIMASCSIPILFEPVRIGDFLFGDGSLRFAYPLSPAIHMGATHVLGISIRPPVQEDKLGFRPDHVGLGFVAGAVLNSMFLDSIECDYEHLCRLNEIAEGQTMRKVQAFLVRPSQDIGALAVNFLDDVPFHLRQLLRSTANPNELGDFLSYLMFSPGYLRALLRLGMEDAERQQSRIRAFLETPGFHSTGKSSAGITSLG